ncbi:MAG: hypothetical protein CBC22_03735 [Alphaproteobacteria bacterium TMED62]|nr:MAG: hypothetical protein CBC22_03735 [Alphaproteobacteria bacterium TMED62]|tara:strand:+ start:2131 stop:2874 length:744 start_codon:yes stop_codon:yes gene_type:complete
MITSAIIIIGNEILSGRTLDLNSNFIAKRCSKIGIKLCEIKIIADNYKEIIKEVLKASKKYKHVFVTGGIGPTHDDITALAIARAFKRKLVLNKKAKELLKKHYENSNFELNKSRMKMAYLPSRATLIANPVSAAPGFKIKNVWVMAGVPKIMQSMFLESVEKKLKKGKIIFSRTVKVKKPEGDIADTLYKINKEYSDLDIGSYPFYKPPDIGTNIVFRCSNKKILEKVIKKFCKLLKNRDIEFTVD